MKTSVKLSKEAQTWHDRLQESYAVVDDAGLLLLQTAFEAFDRMRKAQIQVQADGQTLLDRFDQQKPHPMLPVERDARAQMLAALKQLNFDVEPIKDRPGNPGLKLGPRAL